MIITDLNHIEVVDAANVEGGKSKKPSKPFVSVATAAAGATAFGNIAIATTGTLAVAGPGLAISGSGSYAAAAGY